MNTPLPEPITLPKPIPNISHYGWKERMIPDCGSNDILFDIQELGMDVPEFEPVSYYIMNAFNHDALTTVNLVIGTAPFYGASKKVDLSEEIPLDSRLVPRSKEFYQTASLNRTIKTFTRLILHNYTEHTTLVTLTYAKPCTDRDEHWANLNRMSVRFKRMYGFELNYIAVPEYHKDGIRFHWHLVVNNKYFDYMLFQEEVWRLGFVKVSPKPDSSLVEAGRNLAKYLVKYIGKEMNTDVERKKRYSRGGSWNTDWLVQSGSAPPAEKLVTDITTTLQSAGVPYTIFKCRPYDGQEMWSIWYDAGRFPDIHLFPLLHPPGDTRCCGPFLQNGLTS